MYSHHHTQKLVARKARKFLAQDNRLAVPALEMAYIFQGIAHAPRKIILTRMLPEIVKLLADLAWEDSCLSLLNAGQEQNGDVEKAGSETGDGSVREITLAKGEKVQSGPGSRRSRKVVERLYGKERGGGYWDDFCLAMFLRGVCMRYAAYPVCFPSCSSRVYVY